jgi:hypothetical protein
VWMLDLSALAYLAGVFNFNPANGRWQRSFEISARFIAESPLVFLLWLFQVRSAKQFFLKRKIVLT